MKSTCDDETAVPLNSIENTNEKVAVEKTAHTEGNENWLILVMVTLCNILLGIFWIAFPIFYIEFADHFETSQGVTGWIGSIQNGLQQCLGIFTSSPISMYGYRINVMIGSIIVFLGIVLSAFANSVFYLYITYGVFTGVGMSFVTLSCQVAIQQNFNKNRSIATAVAMMGKSTGQIIGPILIQYLIATYGWRGTLLIFSAMFLHAFAFSLGMGPPKNQKPKKKGIKEALRLISDCTMLGDIMFLLFCISYMLFKFNYLAFYRQLPSRMVHNGMDTQKAALLLSIAGFVQLIGRLVSGIIGNFKNVNRVLFYCVAVFFSGAVTILTLPSVTFWYTSIFAGLNGAATGTVTLLASVVIVDLFGVDKIARSKALFNLFNAVAGFVATPTTGWIFDATRNYNAPFMVAGLSSFVGGCLAVVVYIMHKKRLQSKEELDTGVE